MEFPNTNKPKDLQFSGEDIPFGQNARALEKLDKQIDWLRVGKMYAVGFGVFVASIFILIVAIQLALIIV